MQLPPKAIRQPVDTTALAVGLLFKKAGDQEMWNLYKDTARMVRQGRLVKQGRRSQPTQASVARPS